MILLIISPGKSLDEPTRVTRVALAIMLKHQFFLFLHLTVIEGFVSEVSLSQNVQKVNPGRNSVLVSWGSTVLFYENPRDIKLDSLAASDRGKSDDCFDELVESHPLDDPEPEAPTYSPPKVPKVLRHRQQVVTPNPYGIPQGEGEFEWFRERLRVRHEARRMFGDDACVSKGNVEEALLRHWMAKQRKRFMKTLGILSLSQRSNWGTTYLTRREKERLDAVGFSWAHLQPPSLTNDLIYSHTFQKDVRIKYKDWIWSPLCEQLRAFQRQSGHTRVPTCETLGRWVAEQRRLRRLMPERRRLRLDEMDFDWQWVDDVQPSVEPVEAEPERKAPYVPFSKRMSQLKEYRVAFGDCNVPPDYGDGLGGWVQRMKGRRSELAPRSVLQFERLAFEFDPANLQQVLKP